jgi:hypothetical protein
MYMEYMERERRSSAAAQNKKKVTYDMLEDTPLSQSRCDDSSVNTHA